MIEKICYEKGCNNMDNLTLVDASVGPLWDHRYYCSEHLPEYRNQESKLHLEMKIKYLESVVKQKKREVDEAQQKLIAALDNR